MLNIAGDVSLAGYQLKGVVVDAQFTSSILNLIGSQQEAKSLNYSASHD